MRAFYFRHLQETGQVISGIENLSFDNTHSARMYMERRYRVVVLKLVMLPQWMSGISDLFRRFHRRPLQQDQLIDFMHNLAVMQGGGVSIIDGLNELATDRSCRESQNLARDLLQSLGSGASLSESMARHNDVIPETVRYLVMIGEKSGTLDRTLADGVKHLRRIAAITRDTRRVMIYPLFVLASILGAATFWMIYVIPQVASLFAQMQVELPAMTRLLIHFSDRAGQYLLLFLLLIASVAYVFRIAISVNQRLRYHFHALLLKLPVSRQLISSSSMAFITEYLSLLTQAGINIIDSLHLIEQSMRNEVYRCKFRQIREGITRGNTLSSEMGSSGIFPSFVIRMLRVGEQSGSLGEQLKYLSNEYHGRFDHIVNSISEVIKPVVMLLAGGLFIILIITIFLPIYQIIGQIG